MSGHCIAGDQSAVMAFEVSDEVKVELLISSLASESLDEHGLVIQTVHQLE